jgi:hypothetical protein
MGKTKEREIRRRARILGGRRRERWSLSWRRWLMVMTGIACSGEASSRYLDNGEVREAGVSWFVLI